MPAPRPGEIQRMPAGPRSAPATCLSGGAAAGLRPPSASRPRALTRLEVLRYPVVMTHGPLLVALVAVAALSGCWASEAQLRQRAANDLDCAPDKLVVTEAGGVHRVAGCDKQESYVFSDEAKAWLRESESGGAVKR